MPIQYFFLPRNSLLGMCRKIVKSDYQVCQVCVEEFGSLWTDFCEILMFEYFSKICHENSSFIKI
jgi:hypothetical protein